MSKIKQFFNLLGHKILDEIMGETIYMAEPVTAFILTTGEDQLGVTDVHRVKTTRQWVEIRHSLGVLRVPRDALVALSLYADKDEAEQKKPEYVH